jgi:hypothetical protein
MKMKNKMYEVIYIPRIQDEVSVAEFDTKSEAEDWLENIKEVNPTAYPHHYIKEKHYEE